MAVYWYSCLIFAIFINEGIACCFPEKGEGYFRFTNKKGADPVSSGWYKFSSDTTIEKAYYNGKMYNGEMHDVHILFDYRNDKLYNVTDGLCIVSNLSKPLVKCIPEEAELKVSSYYGTGNDTVKVDIYFVKFQNWYVTLTVEKTSCAVLAETDYSTDEVQNSHFFGLTLGVRNFTVFDIPAACLQNTSREKEDDSMRFTSHLVKL
ncbi:uncharacterized protein LOC127720935 [Mytilus californianus]|uniref:uncharacterized protein LOC127720935 n=1 Tax=Mytilus californianus TaxID=6549 RepID=UPI002247B5D7|nr:uncharacterized protein LOC127720935 [Mytilus californianus]